MRDEEDEFEPRAWAPSERPSTPGAPSTPLHATPKRWAYAIVGLIVALTGSLGNALVTANLVNLQGSLGAYAAEMQWLPTAYAMSFVSMNLVLIKFRQRYGLRSFTVLFLLLYTAVACAHLLVHTLGAAIAVRAAHGLVGAALSSMGLYYTIQAFPERHRIKGVVLGLGYTQLALPLARLFSSRLLEYGEWRGLVLFEIGLSLLSLGCVLALRLPRGDRDKPFELLDLFTFSLFAPGVGLLCMVLTMGRVYWWLDARWIGIALAWAIALVCVALAIEHNRRRPLLNTRWLSTGKIARLMLAILLVRVVLAEATGAVGFLQALGLHTDQMNVLFGWVLLGSVGGLVVSALTISLTNLRQSLMVALALMAAGAWMDAGATSLTGPEQLYLSQFLLAFSGTLFFGPTLMIGFGAVLADPRNVISFTVMFSITQNVGGLLGASLVSTLQAAREKYHSSYLVEHLSVTDPQVAARVSAQGLARLGAAATREANVLAYDDVFMAIAALAVLTLAGMLLLQFLQRCQGALQGGSARP
jgi:MFS family permease